MPTGNNIIVKQHYPNLGNCQYREELMRKRNHYTKAGVGGDYAVGGTYALSDSKEGGRRVK